MWICVILLLLLSAKSESTQWTRQTGRPPVSLMIHSNYLLWKNIHRACGNRQSNFQPTADKVHPHGSFVGQECQGQAQEITVEVILCKYSRQWCALLLFLCIVEFLCVRGFVHVSVWGWRCSVGRDIIFRKTKTCYFFSATLHCWGSPCPCCPFGGWVVERIGAQHVL